jgi:hypothetical protein
MPTSRIRIAMSIVSTIGRMSSLGIFINGGASCHDLNLQYQPTLVHVCFSNNLSLILFMFLFVGAERYLYYGMEFIIDFPEAENKPASERRKQYE